jgi:hypothetical protein
MATFRIEPAGIGSKVLIHTDLTLSGAVAQYGRGVGMIQATAAQIIGQFAGNLRTQLAQQPVAATAQPQPQATPSAPTHADDGVAAFAKALPAQTPPPAPPAAKPISGFSLMARVIWQQIVALLTGRRH